jgi:hypothetical protein
LKKRKYAFNDIVEEYEKIRPTYPKDGEYKIESVRDLNYGEKGKEIIRV